jgi:hypothetical protein
MEAVLDLYEEPYDPKRPGCLLRRETLPAALAEVRDPLPMEPGKAKRFDSEYERKGTAHVLSWRLRASQGLQRSEGD